MIRISQYPTTESPAPHLRLIRTPHTNPLHLYPTSTTWIGVYTHWYLGKTHPCLLPDPCPACEENVPTRWKGYLAAIISQTQEHILWEFPESLIPTLRPYLDEHRTLRHSLIIARRIKPYPTARIIATIRPAPPDIPSLPPEPDILRTLHTIWNLPYTPGQPIPLDTVLGPIHNPTRNNRKRP